MSLNPTLPPQSSTLGLALAALLFVAPAGVFAQAYATNNSFATVIQNNAMMQSNLTRQMINLGGTTPSSGTSSGPATCMPPFELQRGMDGHVPPELQGDPRYQAYLRCKQGQASPQSMGATPGAAPSLPTGQHLPLTATDFVPAQHGHPVVDQAIAGMSIAPEQRRQLRDAIELMFNRVATQYRGNNMAVSVAVAYSTALLTLNGAQLNAQQSRDFIFGVNDKLARGPQFAQMSATEKQNRSDSLIFQAAMITVLREMGQRDQQARQQAVELSRVVMQGLTGA
jgi:hypothetical protein